MGRTARAGREGYAVTFLTDNDRSLLKAIVSHITLELLPYILNGAEFALINCLFPKNRQFVICLSFCALNKLRKIVVFAISTL